jgi:hypothetical protein
LTIRSSQGDSPARRLNSTWWTALRRYGVTRNHGFARRTRWNDGTQHLRVLFHGTSKPRSRPSPCASNVRACNAVGVPAFIGQRCQRLVRI